MKILAIDFGAKRLGLAISENEGRLALPYGVHTRRNNDVHGDLEYLVNLIKVQEIQSIVFGRPAGSEASEKTALQAQIFCNKLVAAAEAAGVPVTIDWWDERYSTAEVLKGLQDAGFSQRRAREATGAGGTDARAAAVILEGFLEFKRSGTVKPQTEEASEF